MSRSIAARALALLLLGAAFSSGVLSAPTLPPLSSSPKLLTEVQTVHSRSSPEQGSLSGLQHPEVEHANLVPRSSELNSAVQSLDLNKAPATRAELEEKIAEYDVLLGVWLGTRTKIDGHIRRLFHDKIQEMRATATEVVNLVGDATDRELRTLKAQAQNILNSC
ncbi:hypothetical protein FB446DRAFT_707830 [Lentinula raphanica]|nr:hypothetical protein FB446DRAFT_707830 [Lentinula raphanica]